MKISKRPRMLVLALVLVLATLLVSSCIPGDGKADADDPAGFFWGVWHGWIAPISLIGSLFNPDLGIYEPFNTGFWYDLGFYMAIISGFGGLSLARRKGDRHVHVHNARDNREYDER